MSDSIPEVGYNKSPSLEGLSSKENESPSAENQAPSAENKVDRLVAAMERGHHVHFQPREGTDVYDVFAHTPGPSMGGTDLEVEQTRPALHTYSEQEAHDHQRFCGSLYSTQRDPSPMETSDPIDEGSHDENLRTLANRQIEHSQEWSTDHDEPILPRRKPEPRATEVHRGRRLYVIGKTGIEVHRVSPIPFDMHKLPRDQTPSLDSHTTVSEPISPSFQKSCKAVVKAAYQKHVLTSTEGPGTGRVDSCERSRPHDVEHWLDHRTKTPSPSAGQAESVTKRFEIWVDDHDDRYSSPVSKEGPLGSLKIWEDIKLDCPSSGTPYPGLSCNALENVTNLHYPYYLPFDNPPKIPTAAADMSNIDAKRVASLRRAKKLPDPSHAKTKDVAERMEMREAQKLVDAVQLTDFHATVQARPIDVPPYPPSSPASAAVSSVDGSSQNGDGIRIPFYGALQDLLVPISPCSNNSSAPSRPYYSRESTPGTYIRVPFDGALHELFVPIPPCPRPSPASSATCSNGKTSQEGVSIGAPNHRHSPIGPDGHSSETHSIAVVTNHQAPGADGGPPLEDEVDRAENLTFTQARLEGRTSPGQSSLITRFVHTSGIYGDDVELSGSEMEIDQPTPLRWINSQTLLEAFESAAEADLS